MRSNVALLRAARAVRAAAAALLFGALLTACGSAPKRGGYYLDDGPGANPPAGLDAVADAVPRDEPIKPASTRPYTVRGTTYRPYAEHRPYRARGRASWYGKRYHGQQTAAGERYDMYAMTAAHTVLPLPSYARVTNLENGRTVVVRINDRGPFLSDRIIDLSYVAAHKLGFVNQGGALVEVEAILPGDLGPAAVPVADATRPPPAPEAGERGTYMQLGAFLLADNAYGFLERMRLELGCLTAPLRLLEGDGLYKVQSGPYANREAAEQDVERVRRALGLSPFVISR